MAELDEALALTWRAGTPADAVRVADATLGEGWLIGAAVNGGLLMALCARAASEAVAATGHTDVLAWSAFFLSAAQPGPARVEVEVLRTGRSVSTVAVRVVQDDGGAGAVGVVGAVGAAAGAGVERMRLTATLGDAATATEPVHLGPALPAMPSPEECLPVRRDGSPLAEPIRILDRLDVRIDPATAGFAVGRPTGRGTIRAWLRMADGREPDVALLPLAVDALMPVAFDLGALGWAPTLELSGQVLGRPAPGWLRVELRTDAVAGGFYVEDADVWDSTGRLVARARQLAGIRVPEGGVAGRPPAAG